MSEEKYKVGQTLWFASHERHRRSGLVKITSIGLESIVDEIQ